MGTHIKCIHICVLKVGVYSFIEFFFLPETTYRVLVKFFLIPTQKKKRKEFLSCAFRQSQHFFFLEVEAQILFGESFSSLVG